jgi:Tfp pilus assembly protein PilN
METAIDFLPERVRLQRARGRRLFRQVGLLVLAGAMFAVWMFFSHRRVARAQAELDLLKDRSANVRRILSQREDLQRQQAELLIKDRIGSRLGSRAGALDVLGELERLLPEGVAIATLNLDGVQLNFPAQLVRERSAPIAAAAAPREGTVNRLRLVLTGVAPGDVDVATFIGQLTASPLFEDVAMGYIRSQVVQGRRARGFQVSCYVVR